MILSTNLLKEINQNLVEIKLSIDNYIDLQKKYNILIQEYLAYDKLRKERIADEEEATKPTKYDDLY